MKIWDITTDDQIMEGDQFDLELGDVLVETTVSEVVEDGVVIHADAQTLKYIMEFVKKSDKRPLSDKPKPKEKTDSEIEKILYKDGKKPLGKVQESMILEGTKKYEAQFKSKEEAMDVAHERAQKQKDSLDGIEVWKVGDGYDICHTMNSNSREHIQKLGGKKVTTVYKEKPHKKDHDKKKDVNEAEYQGRKVPLGKPMKGDVKKSKVYVKGPKGNVVKVNFGDKNMKIKKSNPKRRKSFRARHNCDNPGPRWKARYWSCRAW